MQSRNRFRKSDLALPDLDALFNPPSRLRTSLSNQQIAPLDFSHFRTTLAHQPPTPLKPPRTAKNLREQLNSLQEKLNSAKLEMSFKQQPQVAQSDKKQQKVPLPGAHRREGSRVTREALEAVRKSRIEQFTNCVAKPKNITTFTFNPYNSFKQNQYYLAEVVRAVHEKNSLAVEHISTSLQILRQAEPVRVAIRQQQPQPIRLPRKAELADRKTLVLDLDETLIHCLENADSQTDLSLKITIEGTLVDVDLTIRPYALTFLKKVAKKWEVVVFTASHQSYADAILDELDPEGRLFHHRLYRQHCTLVSELYVKDLSRIDRELSKMVLVDNAAYSYLLQLDNGIPILPYYDGKDFELSALEGYLERLEKSEDVRQMNRDYFQLDRYPQFDSSSALIEQLYIAPH